MHPAPDSTRRFRLNSNVALWASAFVIAALVIVQAQRLAGGAPARADLVSGLGTITALTAEAQTEDVLYIADNRTEQLMVYKVVNQNNFELFRSYSLPRMFADARARASGGRR
jgi:hypothetical protein